MNNRQARIIPPIFEGGKFLFEIRENGRFCSGGELSDDNLLTCIEYLKKYNDLDSIELGVVTYLKVI